MCELCELCELWVSQYGVLIIYGLWWHWGWGWIIGRIIYERTEWQIRLRPELLTPRLAHLPGVGGLTRLDKIAENATFHDVLDILVHICFNSQLSGARRPIGERINYPRCYVMCYCMYKVTISVSGRQAHDKKGYSIIQKRKVVINRVMG